MPTNPTKYCRNYTSYDFSDGMIITIGDYLTGKEGNPYVITSDHSMCTVIDIDPSGHDSEGDILVRVERVRTDIAQDQSICYPTILDISKEFWVYHDEFYFLSPQEINSYNVNITIGKQYHECNKCKYNTEEVDI